MDAASALADLTEVSSQVEAAVVVDAGGAVVASTLDEGGAERLARGGVELLRVAEERVAGGRRKPARIEVALRGGSVFVVRDGDHAIVARTTPRPSSGLVLHDLAACLRSLAPQPKRRRKAPARA